MSITDLKQEVQARLNGLSSPDTATGVTCRHMLALISAVEAMDLDEVRRLNTEMRQQIGRELTEEINRAIEDASNGVNDRFEGIASRLDDLENSLSGVTATVGRLDNDVSALTERLNDEIEPAVTENTGHIRRMLDDLPVLIDHIHGNTGAINRNSADIAENRGRLDDHQNILDRLTGFDPLWVGVATGGGIFGGIAFARLIEDRTWWEPWAAGAAAFFLVLLISTFVRSRGNNEKDGGNADEEALQPNDEAEDNTPADQTETQDQRQPAPAA